MLPHLRGISLPSPSDRLADNKFAYSVRYRIMTLFYSHCRRNSIFMEKNHTVSHNKVVTMQYSLSNADGVVVREAGGMPVSYLHGSGAIPPKLESELETHRIGDIVRVKLLPDDAFGKRDIELLHKVPLGDFPPGEKIEAGGQIVGTDEEGREVLFTVTDIQDGIAHLDGNHPLAGQTLIFEVEIQGIRDATPGEISAGKAADSGQL